MLRTLFAAVMAAVVLSSPSQAVEVTLTPKMPVAKVDFPKGWSVTEIDRGVESRSPDEEVFLWFEVYASSEFNKVLKEHDTYFARQGVKVVGEAKTSSNSLAGVTIQATNLPATWKGAPTVLRYLVFDFGKANRQMMMSVWASPEGDKKHDAAVQGIIESLKAP